MKTTKTILLLMLLYAAGMVNAQCVWYYPNHQGGGTYSYTAYGDSSATSPTYSWTFDDGGTATGPNVQHTFTTTGMHSWCLNYSGNCSVQLCDSQYVNVCDYPVSVSHTEGDTVVAFSAQNVPPGSTYSWTFPDGIPSTSTSATPTIIFPGPGIHWGNLDIVTPTGCSVFANASVNISVEHSTGNCPAWVSAYPGNFGVASFVIYADSSGTTSYNWDFGDGTGSNQQSAQHTYTASGTYTYCANYNGPNCSGSICRTIEIDVCSSGSYISDTKVDSTITFTLNGPPVGSTYAWSFSDGNITSSTAASPVVTFPGAGTYDISVTATTPGGCIINSNTTVTLVTGTCNGNVMDLGPYGDSVQFHVIADSVPGISNSFLWNFGDGTSYTSGQYAGHSYATSGTYNVCVTIYGNMCTNTVCDTVAIDVCQTPAYAGVLSIVGHTATFIVNNVGAGATYQWAFPSGTPSTSTDANPAITFASFGNYTASVTVTTAAGCVKTLVANFAISDNPCNVIANAYDYHAGLIYFDAYPNPYIAGFTYTWDFGDGTTGTGSGAYHTFSASGTYNYCVTYSGSNGCSGTVCGSVTVDICNFYQGMYTTHQDSTYTFYLYSDTMSMWTYQWQFAGGNPATSTDVHPSVAYSASGFYPVTVNYIAHNGCTGTFTDSVYVTVHPACDTAFNLYLSDNNLYPLAADTGTGQNSYSWTFGDGGSTTGVAPLHTYTSNGVYEVCMTVTAPGCSATNCETIVVTLAPHLTLGGTVTKNGTPSSACYAQVYLITDSAGFLSAIDTFTLNGDTGSCLGFYYFDNLPVGTYYVKAALESADPGYADYMPTYSAQELNWADATPVNLTSNTYAVDVSLIPGTNPGGPGFVGGWVTQGAGLGIGGGVDESRAEGDPLAGIQINLLNSAGAPVAYTYSDGSGAFSFNNLALGTYSIYAEAINKVPVALNFTLTQNNPSVNNIAIEINSNSAVGVGEIESMYVDGLMPNPTTNKATLAVTVKQNAEANLTVRDLTGQLVQDRKLQLSAGANNITIDLNAQPAGVYFLNLTGKNGNRVLKLVKTQ